jgi:hypothetical protein
MKNTIKTVAAIALLALTTGCANEKNKFTDTQESTDLIVEQTETATLPIDNYVYVTAVSGLSLRAFNNLDSEKLAVMPYGTKLKTLTIEENETMNVAGIKGGMNEVEYNNKKGFAFNGYLSTLFPPEKNGQAKQYIEDLKATHAAASYTRIVGGTASNPTETINVTLPTNKWHEAFSITQRLFDVPTSFAFPNPKGRDVQTTNNAKKADFMFVSDLKVERLDNELQKITYFQSGEGYGSTVIITKNGETMKIESSNVAD